MKKIFTLLTAALVTLTSFAERADGRITITDLSRKQLWIEVDGKRYHDRDRDVVIDNLRPGLHTVQVFTQERFTDWRGIFDRNGRKQYVFNSTVNVKPRKNICITINRFGVVQVDERKLSLKDVTDDWGRGRDRDYDRDYDRNQDRDYERNQDRDYDRNQGRDYDRDNNYDFTKSAMDARSFEMLKGALSRENFEKTRLEIAKQSIDRNNFNTMQVREMVLLFAFEDSKLDLAKYAYSHTVDKNSYFQLYNVFSFSSSKDELAEYIRRYR